MIMITAAQAAAFAARAEDLGIWKAIKENAKLGNFEYIHYFPEVSTDDVNALIDQLNEAGFKVSMRWHMNELTVSW